jgi:hypothetical protein
MLLVKLSAEEGIVDGFERFQQFGVINFHAWWGSEAALTPAIKNKWSPRRAKA